MLEELDDDLTGLEKKFFKYKEEQPKLKKEERLERFKNKWKRNTICQKRILI